MRIHLIAVGTRIPSWINEGYQEYARRMPHGCALDLHEIPAAKRGKSTSLERALQTECRQMLDRIPDGCRVIALDVRGKAWSTEALAQELRDWLGSGRDIALLVGGADGLSADCLERADLKWSLSALTYPHALVRVVLAEQLYRAWTITTGHPYHRS